MKFNSIRVDDAGESHFEAFEICDHQIPIGPPPNPSGTRADFGAVENMFAFAVPPGVNTLDNPVKSRHDSVGSRCVTSGSS